MDAFDWESFLRQWSQDILDSIGDDERRCLLPEILDSGWLGYPGATEDEIARAEARLGVKLPPSYRTFLEVTNGWRQTASKMANYNHRFWSTEDIERFAVRHSQWIRAFIDRTEILEIPLEDEFQELNDRWEPVGISDNDYFVYGEDQDPRNLRSEYLKTAIEISDVGFASIYLLNPQVVTPEGEWEAWFFADYLPGADRYRSFQEMMEAEYRNFLEMQEVSEDDESAIAQPEHSEIELNLIDDLENPIELSSADASFETKIYPPRETPQEATPNWQSLDHLLIDLQGRQLNSQAEYRIIASSRHLSQPQTWPGLAEHQLQQWLRQHLIRAQNIPLQTSAEQSSTQTSSTEDTVPPLSRSASTADKGTATKSERNVEPNASPSPLKVNLDLEHLAIHQATHTDAVIVVRPAEYSQVTNSFLGALNSQHPFSIEVAFHLAIARNNNPDLPKIFYKTQVFAQNRVNHEWIEMGESDLKALESDRSNYTSSLFNKRLASGMYRLQVITSLTGATKALSSFELPLLSVI